MEKDNTPNSPADKASEEYLNQYIRLRTVLDSLESISLYYSLSGKSEGEKIKRFKKLERILKPALKEITELAAPKPKKTARMVAMDDGNNNGCPPGYCNCNGVCVPSASRLW